LSNIAGNCGDDLVPARLSLTDSSIMAVLH